MKTKIKFENDGQALISCIVDGYGTIVECEPVTETELLGKRVVNLPLISGDRVVLEDRSVPSGYSSIKHAVLSAEPIRSSLLRKGAAAVLIMIVPVMGLSQQTPSSVENPSKGSRSLVEFVSSVNFE